MEEEINKNYDGAILAVIFFMFILSAGAMIGTENIESVVEEIIQYFFGGGGDIIRAETYELRAEVNEFGGETRGEDYELQTSGIQSDEN